VSSSAFADKIIRNVTADKYPTQSLLIPTVLHIIFTGLPKFKQAKEVKIKKRTTKNKVATIFFTLKSHLKALSR
jgi:hypothetical protein